MIDSIIIERGYIDGVCKTGNYLYTYPSKHFPCKFRSSGNETYTKNVAIKNGTDDSITSETDDKSNVYCHFVIANKINFESDLQYGKISNLRISAFSSAGHACNSKCVPLV